MDEELAVRLRQKGWDVADIAHASQILNDSEHKVGNIKFLDAILYWAALLVAILGNMVLSIVLIPFLLALHGLILYTVIITLGIAFGVLFDMLIRDIDTIGTHHHIMAGLFIPSLAIINVIYMTNFANSLTISLELTNIHSPLLVGAVYTIAFVIPYAVSHVMVKKSARVQV